MKILSCKDVSVKYDSVFALKNCSFELEAGDFLGIFGKNGSGKTTLLKSIAGLIKLYSGTIDFHGIKKKEIGYVAQQIVIQKDFPASVFEAVISATHTKHKNIFFYSKEDKKLVDKNLELLGIKDLKQKSIQELSGGQRQRVMLARMLCAEAKLLLLDEPTSGLDSATIELLHGVLKEINLNGTTIIMVSHDEPNTKKDCNRTLYL